MGLAVGNLLGLAEEILVVGANELGHAVRGSVGVAVLVDIPCSGRLTWACSRVGCRRFTRDCSGSITG